MYTAGPAFFFPKGPPAGTLLSTYCQGFDKYGVYANGYGGTYDQLIQANSAECGYVPFQITFATSGAELSENNRLMSFASTPGYNYCKAGRPKGSGKWYYEVEYVETRSQGYSVGVIDNSYALVQNVYPPNSVDYASTNNGQRVRAGVETVFNAGVETGVRGIGLDLDNNTITYYVNGENLGVMYSNMTGSNYVPWISSYTSGGYAIIRLRATPLYLPAGYTFWGA